MEEVVPAVKSWFQIRMRRFLVVFGSADDIYEGGDEEFHIDLDFFLPDVRCIDIIITTRTA